jgi:hypothetical protein
VTSSLDGLARLPVRIHWEARTSVPPREVSEVDFLIDGRLGWVEHEAPYDYGDDGNWLVTTFLPIGWHVFTTRVITVDGRSASDQVSATTPAAAAPPAALAGSWSRLVTAADLQRAGAGPGGPPPGVWKDTFDPTGLVGDDPQGDGGISDIQYLPGDRVRLRPTLEHPPFPSPNNGGWCADTDPLAVYAYSLGNHGKTLTLRPETGADPCPYRQGVLAGTWTRIPPDPRAHRLATT